jgi:hypothetical protein
MTDWIEFGKVAKQLEEDDLQRSFVRQCVVTSAQNLNTYIATTVAAIDPAQITAIQNSGLYNLDDYTFEVSRGVASMDVLNHAGVVELAAHNACNVEAHAVLDSGYRYDEEGIKEVVLRTSQRVKCDIFEATGVLLADLPLFEDIEQVNARLGGRHLLGLSQNSLLLPGEMPLL